MGERSGFAWAFSTGLVHGDAPLEVRMEGGVASFQLRHQEHGVLQAQVVVRGLTPHQRLASKPHIAEDQAAPPGEALRLRCVYAPASPLTLRR